MEALEETRTQLVMVTEAVFCSVGNLLNSFQGLPDKVLPHTLCGVPIDDGTNGCAHMLSWCGRPSAAWGDHVGEE